MERQPQQPSRSHYAGIGSRETPEPVLVYMRSFATGYAERGYVLRSGGARGADTAFEKGCDSVDGPKEIYRPEDAKADAFKHAAQFHPNWYRLSQWAKALHARNSLIMLGPRLNDPVEIVVCWTPKGVKIDGTAQALRIAEEYHIEIVNLGDESYGFE